MFFCFLFELTWFAPQLRQKIFKTELMKVFLTACLFYFLSLILTMWLGTLSEAIAHEIKKKEDSINAQRRYHETYKRGRSRGTELEIKKPKSDNEICVEEFEAKGLNDQNMADTIFYFLAKFEIFLDENCTHLMEKEYKRQV